MTEWPLLGRRFAARVIDLVIATGINLLVSAGLSGITTGWVAMVALSVAAFAAYAGYEVVLTGVYGATPGKLWLWIRPLAADGRSAPTPGAVLVRSSILFGSLLFTYVPLLNLIALMAAVYAVVSSAVDRPDHRGLQDKAAGTVIADARPGAPVE